MTDDPRPVTRDRWRMLPNRTVEGGVMRRQPVLVVPEDQVREALDAADQLADALGGIVMRPAQARVIRPLLEAFRGTRRP